MHPQALQLCRSSMSKRWWIRRFLVLAPPKTAGALECFFVFCQLAAQRHRGAVGVFAVKLHLYVQRLALSAQHLNVLDSVTALTSSTSAIATARSMSWVRFCRGNAPSAPVHDDALRPRADALRALCAAALLAPSARGRSASGPAPGAPCPTGPVRVARGRCNRGDGAIGGELAALFVNAGVNALDTTAAPTQHPSRDPPKMSPLR